MSSGGPENFFSSQYMNGPEKVQARFELYKFGRPYLDIEDKVINSLQIIGDESWCDVGTSTGSFLQKIRMYGHIGELSGVEPNTMQYNYASIWEPLDEDPVRERLQRNMGNYLGSLVINKISNKISNAIPRDISLLSGHANKIPLENNSQNILSEMFMFYHIPEYKQQGAIDEIKRVLKPDGLFVLATSGIDNKFRHRMLEQKIADSMENKVIAPKLMNDGFSTEKAQLVLPQNFKYNKIYFNETDMVIDSSYRLKKYLNSLRSLHDQFSPIPSTSDFEEVLNYEIAPEIIYEIEKNGEFVDKIRRSIIISSDKPFNLNGGEFIDL